MIWDYKSATVPGNLHDAAHYINEHHPEWDVVTIWSSGRNSVIVYRTERNLQ